MEKLEVCSRVTLYFNDNGFRFCCGLNKPDNEMDVQPWSSWAGSWQGYTRDGIQKKLMEHLRAMPERYRLRKFYQSITF